MYITIRYNDAKNYEDAVVYFNNIEGDMERDFMEMGSRLIALSAKERLEIIHNIFRFGKEEEFDFDLSDLLKRG